jgi:hypothetical protein
MIYHFNYHCLFASVVWCTHRYCQTLQNFIYKHIIIFKNVQKKKGKKKGKEGENLKDARLAPTTLKISSFQQSTVCNRLVMGMGGVSPKGESRKVARPTIITQFKMEDVCILSM